MDIKCNFEMNESGEVKAIPVPIRGLRYSRIMFDDACNILKDESEKELEKLTKKFKAEDWI